MHFSLRQGEQICDRLPVILEFRRGQHKGTPDPIRTQAMQRNAAFPRHRDAAVRMWSSLQWVTLDGRQHRAIMAIWLH
ncbi:hypothetical protein EOS_16870 [Caballeronia mineralivorans PML1(12)]|uniref:Uncharacterized protein n=1 Tax=Caballeronia mineralivorans PML1(12) TaxID=908627 RepID=A0A0J1CWL2_9BURK|nr:hypothetical protein EOS_16870 [Caballeronia mineralivorans PML1(12)]